MGCFDLLSGRLYLRLPTKLKEAALLYDKSQAASAEIINPDTAVVHKAWHDESAAIHIVNDPMGADPTGNVSRAFRTYI